MRVRTALTLLPLFIFLSKPSPAANLEGDPEPIPDPTPIVTDSTVTMSGTLGRWIADDFENKRSSDIYTLTSQGKIYTLQFAGNPLNHLTSGSQIMVSGVLGGSVLSIKDWQKDIQVMPASPTSSQSSSVGNIRTAVILFNFVDKRATPLSRTDALNKVFKDADSSKSFYEEGSYGQTHLVGKNYADASLSDIYGWYQSPYTASCNAEDYISKTLEIQQALGIDTADYDKFLFIFPADGCTPGTHPGAARLGGSDAVVRYDVTRPSIFLGTINHELGHTFGLDHARGLECGEKSVSFTPGDCALPEYGDVWDSMGHGLDAFKHFSSLKKMQADLNWIPTFRQQDITADGDYTLYRLEDLQAGPMVLRVPITSNVWYTVEYRQPIGLEKTDPNNNYTRWGSLIHLNLYGLHTLIDTTPSSVGDDFSDAALVDGASFADPENLITIQQVGHNDTSATIRVKLNCARMNPSLSFDPQTQAGPAGTVANYTVTIYNQDRGACGNTTFQLSAINYAGGGFNFDQDQIEIEPGGFRAAQLHAGIPAGLPSDGYPILVQAVDASDSLHGVSDFANYQVNCQTPQSPVAMGAASASDSCPIPKVTVSISPAAQTGTDGRQVDYAVDVRNDGTDTKAFNLNLVLPPGWNAFINSALLTVGSGKTASTTMRLTIPSKQVLGTYDIGVHAVDINDVTNRGYAATTYTVASHPSTIRPTVNITPSSQSGPSGGTLNYTVNVINNYPSALTFQLNATLPSPFWSAGLVGSITLAAGETKSVQMSVTSALGLLDGSSYAFSVTATDPSMLNYPNSATANYVIQAAPTCLSQAPTFTFTSAKEYGGPDGGGTSTEYTFFLKNNDSSDCAAARFNLAATLPSGWTYSFDPSSLDLGPGQSKISGLRITYPANVLPPGTVINKFNIPLKATDAFNPSHYGSDEVYFTVFKDVTGKRTIRSGNWSDPSIWQPTGVPYFGDRLDIYDNVVLDAPEATAYAIRIWKGSLSFSREISSQLTIEGWLIVDPTAWLDMGTETSPIPPNIKAEIRLLPNPYNPNDPNLHSITVKDGGKFTVQGALKTASATALEDAPAGATSILIKSPNMDCPHCPTLEFDPTAPWSVGDEITVDTERRTIASVVPGTPTQIVLSEPLSLPHYVADTIRVGNLTRNARVFASVDDTYHQIQNKSLAPNDFVIRNAEFAHLGKKNLADGIVFSAGAKGFVFNSVIRDGANYALTLLSQSSNNVFKNNLIYNNRGGIHLADFNRNNVLDANQIYSNSIYNNPDDWGLWMYRSFNNTVISNIIYSNHGGILLSGGCRGNSLVSNSIYKNVTIGFDFDDWQDPNTNSFLSNYSYANYLDYTAPQTPLTWAEGGLGYDPRGNSRPASWKEVLFQDRWNAEAILLLKGTHFNTSAGMTLDIFSDQGAFSVLSYNGDDDLGTIRLWGKYTVRKSTLTLDYFSSLYPSTASIPKLMQGMGHSASVATNDVDAVSQLISITYSGTTWNVEGSFSGLLGTFSGSILNQPFPASNPQFTLTFTPGSSPQNGDFMDFVLIASSKDALRQKKLLIGSSPFNSNRTTNRSKLIIDPSAGFSLKGGISIKLGTETPSLMDRLDSSSAYYTFVDSGALTLNMANISNADENGIQLSGSGGISMFSTTFDLAGQGNSLFSTYITAKNLISQATLDKVSFNTPQNWPQSTVLYNIRVPQNEAGLSWLVTNWSGSRGGPIYESDPYNKISWGAGGPALPEPEFSPLPPSPTLQLVNLLKSDGTILSLGKQNGGPRALMVSQAQGFSQQLVFGPQVKEAKITDLTGREISHVSQNGSEPLVISLQENSGLRISTGFNLIQMRVCEESNPGVCKWQGRALIVIK
ncbi:MAG: right-handed parallel beta-helix repeat-containing protein [Elusimicrobia bacterium]|nr:right-handed parallel beta-helix repeat-containing protein [Elusimicrobiota bacterium]